MWLRNRSVQYSTDGHRESSPAYSGSGRIGIVLDPDKTDYLFFFFSSFFFPPRIFTSQREVLGGDRS